MDSPATRPIPNRAETLEVLRLMGDFEAVLMLSGDADGFGTRWTLHGEQVQPGIARYLMDEGFIADSGATELGARKLALTAAGRQFREDGTLWWAGLKLLQRIRIKILG
jgi:hypothetical protein